MRSMSDTTRKANMPRQDERWNGNGRQESRGENGHPEAAEWTQFRRDAETLRKDLERFLRRRLVHDARAAKARLQNIAPADLADEAFAWALDEWRSKPATTTPELWARKRALQLLDEMLDSEALAAESRAEERAEESRLHAHELLADDEERERWLEILDGAGDEPVPFEGLAADDDVSRVESRLDETEMLGQLDRALSRLPEVRRRVVVHSFIDELTPEDVAYLLDLSVGHVEQELAAGVAALREDLAPRG
jgi:RNA polymerase sigma factor (sigma-70 family)